MEKVLKKLIEGLNLPDCHRKILEAAITEYVFYCIRIAREEDSKKGIRPVGAGPDLEKSVEEKISML